MLTARTITGAGAGVGEVYGPSANALVAPPNPNAALEQFLATDPDSGLTVFDADAWRTYAMTNASWASASWSAASWSAASWSAASWASASWASASWASASWASASWAVASWAASTDVE
jgi:hypothetical protein